MSGRVMSQISGPENTEERERMRPPRFARPGPTLALLPPQTLVCCIVKVHFERKAQRQSRHTPFETLKLGSGGQGGCFFVFLG